MARTWLEPFPSSLPLSRVRSRLKMTWMACKYLYIPTGTQQDWLPAAANATIYGGNFGGIFDRAAAFIRGRFLVYVSMIIQIVAGVTLAFGIYNEIRNVNSIGMISNRSEEY